MAFFTSRGSGGAGSSGGACGAALEAGCDTDGTGAGAAEETFTLSGGFVVVAGFSGTAAADGSAPGVAPQALTETVDISSASQPAEARTTMETF
jgi:hypothetical protein